MKLKSIQKKLDGLNYIDLSKLVGKKITGVLGHLTDEFGQPNFQLDRIVFEDGTHLYVEGEHDFPYVTNGGTKDSLPEEEVLEDLMKQDPDYEAPENDE